MRQSDFYTAAMHPAATNLTATATTAPAKATASLMAAADGGSFARLLGEVQSDVNDFIQHGSADAPPASMATLSAEGQVQRARLQAALSTEIAGDETQQQFLTSIAPWAQEAGQRLGVSADLVAAHAALESGWGRQPLRQADGADSHNLFALKAGAHWPGDTTQSMTTEYANGNALKTSATFRSYPDQASAFRDYAHLLLNNPRYGAALNTGSDAHAFAQGLVRGGYATDPAYAGKLARIAAQIQNARQVATSAGNGAGSAARSSDQPGD